MTRRVGDGRTFELGGLVVPALPAGVEALAAAEVVDLVETKFEFGVADGLPALIAPFVQMLTKLPALISNSITFRRASSGCAGNVIVLPLIVRDAAVASDLE